MLIKFSKIFKCTVKFISFSSLGCSFPDRKLGSMSSITCSEVLSSPVSATRLFNALIMDADNLLPKLLPQAIKSFQLIQGNGGSGSVKIITFTEGDETKFLKQRVDELDKENLTYKYTVFEGDALKDAIESISYETKFESSEDGGCKGTNVSIYFPKPGVEIKEEQIKEEKEKATGLFKAVEAYLLANPDVYA